ncbi:MAG: hypothetical protein JNK76_22650 [Planctomycetales bacterium]|nr:hypothetical protein [Planctomycetales bacterium]MBN8626010.1 hypothetical protein [Planctomycetota bacterium]
MTHTVPTRQNKQDDLASMQRLLDERESLPKPERMRRRLAELQSFVELLGATDVGQAELAQRRERYGECTQGPRETDGDFYCRLRTWLDGGL